MKFLRYDILILAILLVVIMAIGIAIFIPSHTGNQFLANANAAAVSLKSLVITEVHWAQNDTDRNDIKDYWVADISGFYRVLNAKDYPVGNIDITFTRADYAPLYETERLMPLEEIYGNQHAPGPITKSGYFFAAFVNDENGVPYRHDLNRDGLARENASKFAFMCFPEKHAATGRLAFIVNESGVIYKIDPTKAEGIGGRNAGKSFNDPVTGGPTTKPFEVPITDWPAVDPTTVGYTRWE